MWVFILLLLDATSTVSWCVQDQAFPGNSTGRRLSEDSVRSSLQTLLPEIASPVNLSASSVEEVQRSLPSGFTFTFESEVLKTRKTKYGLPMKQPKIWFSGLLAGNRKVRSVFDNTDNRGLLPVNNLLSLFPSILEDKIPVILYDSDVLTVDVLDQYLLTRPHLPVVVFDISDDSLLTAEWLDQYNAAMFLHILLFNSLNVVDTFAEVLPERVWVPSHLLLVNVNASVDASRLLAQENFNYSPFLSLLQPDSRNGTTRYHILTYETFRPHNKITSHGVYSFDQPQTYASVFPDRFSTFYGYSLHLASWVDDFPYLVPGPTLEETYGMCANMLNEISRKLNFTITYYKEPEDQMWARQINGSWYGLLGELWRREKDLCVDAMIFKNDRFQAVDYSVPYYSGSASFAIRNPQPPPRWWSIVFPFTWQTWIAVLTSIVIVSVVLLAILKSLSQFTAKDVSSSSVSWVVLEVVRMILRQDVTTPPPASSVRVFEGMWLLLAMVISISYTGNLVAYITVPGIPHRLTSLKELAESSLTPSVEDNGNFVKSTLLSSKDQTLKTLGRKMELIPVNDKDLIFQKINDGTHAYLEGKEYFLYLLIVHNMASSTYFLPDDLFQNAVGWTFPKNTPWKHKFDSYLQSLVESGLCLYWREALVLDLMMEHGNTLQQDFQEQPPRALSLQDLQGTFLVHGLFLLTATIIGLLELLY